MDPPTPIEPPPPAYSEEQRELDRKISYAVQLSSHPQPSTDEEAWEVWDDAIFAANMQQRPDMSPRSSTSQVPTQNPGRRLPASPSSDASTKERPNWLAQANLESPDSAPSDEPLPAFAAVGPSLEGPSFEELVRVEPWVPAAPGDSPPESPLDSVDGSDSPPHPPRSVPPMRPYVRTSSPSASRAAPVQAKPTRPPSVPFDHSLAYAKSRPSPIDSEEKTAGPVDASALYNSAVSSLYAGPSHPQVAQKSNALSRHSFPGTGSSTLRTSDPYAPHVAEPYTSQALNTYAPASGPAFSPTHSQPSYAPKQQPPSPQLQQYPPQQLPYSPQRQQQYPPQPYPPQQRPYPPQQQPYIPQQRPSPQQRPYSPPPQSYPHVTYVPGPADGQGPSVGPWTPNRNSYGSQSHRSQ